MSAVQDAKRPARTGLQRGALRRRDVVVLALASSGPTQSVAVSLAAILATVAYAGFLPLLISFIPMLGIALGYQRLNAWKASAGATYSWVGKALNPHVGFFAGWIMLMYYTVGTTSLTVPIGTYLLSFFSDAAANNKYWVALVGSAFDIFVMAIAAAGAKLSARFQWGWATFEYLLVFGFAVAAVIGIYSGSIAHTVHISGSWFTIHGAGGFHALISGVLLAIFLYSGWDTAAYVGEETEGKGAGSAAVLSVVLLFVIYSVTVIAFAGVAPNSAMQAHASNILAFVGHRIGGSVWKQLMIVAVLGGTLASLQAAILSAGRIGFAMGRDRVFPGWFGTVSERYRTPWNATVLFGLLNIVFLWASTLIGPIGKMLNDIVATLGLMAALFYLLTATAAVVYYRRKILASFADFFVGGLLPTFGAAFMAFVIIYELATDALNTVQIAFGFGLALLGLALSFVARAAGGGDYFSQPRQSYGDEEPDAELEIVAAGEVAP